MTTNSAREGVPGTANLRSTARRGSVRSILRPFIFFPILVSFLSFSDFKKFFQEKNFEKKKAENFDEKNFREKNLRWKIKEKNWRAENFLKKKIRKQGTFKRKKLYEQI